MFYSDIFTIYPCMRDRTSFSPQSTFFNDVFINYFLYATRVRALPLNQRFLIVRASLIFCMCRMSQVPISPQATFYSDIFAVYLYMVFVCLKLHQFPPSDISKDTRITFPKDSFFVDFEHVFVCWGTFTSSNSEEL